MSICRTEVYLAIFRVIEDSNIIHYRIPLMQVVSMLLRLVSLSESKRASDKSMAALLLVGSKTQKLNSKTLHDILIASKGKRIKDNVVLRQVLHRLLESLLCPGEILPDVNFQCPTEISLFLSSLSGNGYKTAASVKQHCCKMQFSFRIIYLHIVRMDAYQLAEYQPFQIAGKGLFVSCCQPKPE